MERKKDYIDYGLEAVKGVIDVPLAAIFLVNCALYLPYRAIAGLGDGTNHFGEKDIYDAKTFDEIRDMEEGLKYMYNFLVHGYFDKNDKEGTSLRGFYDGFINLLKNEGLEGQINSTSTSRES